MIGELRATVHRNLEEHVVRTAQHLPLEELRIQMGPKARLRFLTEVHLFDLGPDGASWRGVKIELVPALKDDWRLVRILPTYA